MTFMDEVLAERRRQIEELGYDADHDDLHELGEIGQAAAALALPPDDGRDRALFWPWVGSVPRSFTERKRGDRRAELVKAAAMIYAEADRIDRAGLPPQAYLPHGYCWRGSSVQCAVAVRDAADAFLHRHRRLRAYSGLRPHEAGGDHRCGFAIDFVPTSYDDRRSIQEAHDDAVRAGYAYVEPLDLTWTPTNHHLHVSFRRCP